MAPMIYKCSEVYTNAVDLAEKLEDFFERNVEFRMRIARGLTRLEKVVVLEWEEKEEEE